MGEEKKLETMFDSKILGKKEVGKQSGSTKDAKYRIILVHPG